MENIKYPKITLVGAGPGDVELLTIKAVNALGEADVVLYDALVNPEVLKFAPHNALKIYVGKRNKNHSFSQEQINTLLVDFAFSHGHVVRLKGGDSFVFGRGWEEVKYAELFNIETTVIPGISSSLAVPAAAGIPVTHRGVADSFWVITGTTSSGHLAKDVSLAVKSNATVVILMGLGKLKEIAQLYLDAGKENLPIAVIQNGTLPNQRTVLGTVDTIVDLVKEEGIQAPAIIIAGEVVREQADFPAALTDWKFLLN